MSATIRIIKFNKESDKLKVSDKSMKIIKALMEEANITEITITSTARNAQEQARAMYTNLERDGVAAQKELYGSAGDSVIDEYKKLSDAKKTQVEIVFGMKEKIEKLGATKISKHAADSSKVNVVDISPKKLQPKSNQSKFEKAIKNSSSISRYFLPPKDPAIHIEIDQ